MIITIFMNNGKRAKVSCENFSNGDLNTLARQISKAPLVNLTRAIDAEGHRLDYVDGLCHGSLGRIE